MTAPDQDAPRPKMPSLRTLLVRAVAALEKIAELLDEHNTHRWPELAGDELERCAEPFRPFPLGPVLNEDATAVMCTRLRGDSSGHVHVEGFPDDLHWDREQGVEWRTK